jgi:ubiquinone biosynthesis protein
LHDFPMHATSTAQNSELGAYVMKKRFLREHGITEAQRKLFRWNQMSFLSIGSIEITFIQADREALLNNLEREPLGSGSIGECYRSKLADGTPIVVKIITPSKRKKFTEAIARAKALAPTLELYAEEVAGVREAHRLLGMFTAMVEKELDLRQEGWNSDKMREKLPEESRNFFGIPEIFYAKNGVLVQQYVQGQKLASIPDAALRKETAEKIRALFLMGQILGWGFYHSDLQPGNILVDPTSKKVWLLDFGQVGELSEAQRKHLSQFIGASGGAYSKGIVEALEEMGEKQKNYEKEALVQEVQKILDSHPQIGPENTPEIVNYLFRKCHEKGLWIDLTYLQLLKGLATWEATARSAQ